MKVIKKNVYYCDFCGKRSLASLLKHELHCTANPDRKCRMPGCCTGDIKPIIYKFKELIIHQYKAKGIFRHYDEVGCGIGEEVGYEVEVKLFDDVCKEIGEWCPACTLAVLRQCKIFSFTASITDKIDKKLTPHSGDNYQYDFEKDMQEFWREVNSNRQEEREVYY